MRIRGSAAVVLAVSAGVAAAPRSPARPSWADWVGAYTGKLAWPGCSTPGERSATLALDAVDGALAIDLTPAGGGLRPMSLVDDGAGWIAQQGGVQLRIARARADVVELHVELGSDCTVRGELRRATTRIAACDQLVAWTRIEAACSRLVAAPLEDPAALAKERATWRPNKPAIAEQCAARAAKVEAALVEVGCAPDPRPPSRLRAPVCASLVDAAQRFQECALAMPNVKAAALNEATSLLAGVGTADDASLPVLATQCRDAHARLAQIAAHSRCPL